MSDPKLIKSNSQTVTLSAAALTPLALSNGITLKADYANTGIISVGGPDVTTATGYPLKAGEPISYGVCDLSAIFIIGTNTTDKLWFTGN